MTFTERFDAHKRSFLFEVCNTEGGRNARGQGMWSYLKTLKGAENNSISGPNGPSWAFKNNTHLAELFSSFVRPKFEDPRLIAMMRVRIPFTSKTFIYLLPIRVRALTLVTRRILPTTSRSYILESELNSGSPSQQSSAPLCDLLRTHPLILLDTRHNPTAHPQPHSSRSDWHLRLGLGSS